MPVPLQPEVTRIILTVGSMTRIVQMLVLLGGIVTVFDCKVNSGVRITGSAFTSSKLLPMQNDLLQRIYTLQTEVETALIALLITFGSAASLVPGEQDFWIASAITRVNRTDGTVTCCEELDRAQTCENSPGLVNLEVRPVKTDPFIALFLTELFHR